MWHQEVCLKLGIPFLGENSATGAFAYDSCGTTGWCEYVQHPEDERGLGSAVNAIAFGNKLHNRDECCKMGWFKVPEDI